VVGVNVGVDIRVSPPAATKVGEQSPNCWAFRRSIVEVIVAKGNVTEPMIDRSSPSAYTNLPLSSKEN